MLELHEEVLRSLGNGKGCFNILVLRWLRTWYTIEKGTIRHTSLKQTFLPVSFIYSPSFSHIILFIIVIEPLHCLKKLEDFLLLFDPNWPICIPSLWPRLPPNFSDKPHNVGRCMFNPKWSITHQNNQAKNCLWNMYAPRNCISTFKSYTTIQITPSGESGRTFSIISNKLFWWIGCAGTTFASGWRTQLYSLIEESFDKFLPWCRQSSQETMECEMTFWLICDWIQVHMNFKGAVTLLRIYTWSWVMMALNHDGHVQCPIK